MPYQTLRSKRHETAVRGDYQSGTDSLDDFIFASVDEALDEFNTEVAPASIDDVEVFKVGGDRFGIVVLYTTA